MKKRRSHRNAPWNNDPNTAVVYLRVSTEDQHLGPEAQRVAVEAFLASRKGTTIAAVVTEHISGTTPPQQRPGIMQALAEVRKLIRKHNSLMILTM